jgi:hypothetical protein
MNRSGISTSRLEATAGCDAVVRFDSFHRRVLVCKEHWDAKILAADAQ